DWASGGGHLNVIDCVATGFAGVGILINPASGSPILNVTIANSVVLNNVDGIDINPQAGAGQVNYSISHTITNANLDNGISVTGGASSGSMSFVHSEMNGNGLSFNATTPGPLTVTNSVLRNNSADITNPNTAIGSILYVYDANTIGVFSVAPGSVNK